MTPKRVLTTVAAAALALVAAAAALSLAARLPAEVHGRPAPTVAAPPWEAGGELPRSFDLRTLGWVTPVREQQGYSTCWVMACTGALESRVVRETGSAPDYSENNLANHMASRLFFEGMAPAELALAYWARWEGPVPERDDPYPAPLGSPTFLRAARHVEDVLFLPPRRGPLDNDAIKWALMTYGAVDAEMAWEKEDWNPDTNAYYASGGTPDHHVLCVGWDDDFPASRFRTRPPGDGAFLIKNSWGTDFGADGYFWLSYYDAVFGRRTMVVARTARRDDFDAVYQYDALGRSAWWGDGTEDAWFANRFRCAGSGDLQAVAFYTPVVDTSFEVRVAGSLDAVATAPVVAAGTLAVPGYHTVRLDTAVRLRTGDAFVVAVRVHAPGWERPVAVERKSALIAPRARPGQSFVSADGRSWRDLTGLRGDRTSNVCLKAFLVAAGDGDRLPPRTAVRAGDVRAGGTLRVAWRLDDPAFSCASAIVVLRVRDAAGRVRASRRIPAVAVGERGTWTLRAGWPPGTYRASAVAFDVAGHRQPAASADTFRVLPAQ